MYGVLFGCFKMKPPQPTSQGDAACRLLLFRADTGVVFAYRSSSHTHPTDMILFLFFFYSQFIPNAAMEAQ